SGNRGCTRCQRVVIGTGAAGGRQGQLELSDGASEGGAEREIEWRYCTCRVYEQRVEPRSRDRSIGDGHAESELSGGVRRSTDGAIWRQRQSRWQIIPARQRPG